MQGSSVAEVLDTPFSITSHPALIPESESLDGCGGKLVRTLFCLDCGHGIDVPITCGDRSCIDCRRRSYLRLRAVYMPLMKQVKAVQLALVTLTLRITGDIGEGLRDRVERIRAAWRRLIRLKVWRPVRGGLYTIEVKWSSRYAGAWNVHIHALVEARGAVRPWRSEAEGKEKADIIGAGATLSPQALSQAWEGLTGDSYIVDIVPVQERRGGVMGAFKYILKYLTKATGLPHWQAKRAYNGALAGKRLIQTFGEWHDTHKLYRFVKLRVIRPVVPCGECGGTAGWMSGFEFRRLRLRASEVSAGPSPPAVRPVFVVVRPQYVQGVVA